MKRLVQSARKIFDHAEKQYCEGDEEMAYIYYNRYFNMLNRIHQRPDYQNNKTLIRQTLGGNRTNKMRMDRLEVISKSLVDRYDLLKKSTALNNDVTSGDSGNLTSVTSPVSLMLSPTNSNQNTSNKQQSLKNSQTNGHRSRSSSPIGSSFQEEEVFRNLSLITHDQLFECMRLQNVLIMDCRSSSDYKTSHLNYAVLLNVPEEHIKAG